MAVAVKIITLMLIRMIAVRFVALLFGISIFVLSLEAVSYSVEIMALRPGDPWIVSAYILYRAPVTLVNHPVRYDGEAAAVRLPPQPLGAQTREVLTELGFAAAEIDALARDGVIKVSAE